MTSEVKSANIEKFMKLDEKKCDRIINAAMKEFRYGFKRASTDTIVKDAGISKGLLYHYFGTKIQLFEFLCTYTTNILRNDYLNVLDLGQCDILEAFWQYALLKRDIMDRHPHIYEYMFGINAHKDDIPEEMLTSLLKENEDSFTSLVDKCDLSLFREDVDARAAVDIIFWSIEGYFEHMYLLPDVDYGKFMDDLRTYLDTFRLCFYKQTKEDGQTNVNSI